MDDPAGRVVTVAAREPKMDAQPLKPALKKPKEATRNQNNDKHSSRYRFHFYVYMYCLSQYLS